MQFIQLGHGCTAHSKGKKTDCLDVMQIGISGGSLCISLRNYVSPNIGCLKKIVHKNLFILNFAAPSFYTVKCQNKKGVRFVAGEHAAIFECITQIYIEAKEAHGVHGLVPVILAEDETKVKTRITWEPQTDVLAGFCGTKEGHVCITKLKLEVGSGQEGYAKIVDAFKSNIMDGFARVVMVNPLHDKLPRLVLVVSCTCNCFDSG
jgi:hypothetical protein